MAYCQSAEKIKSGQSDKSWIDLQLRTHQAHCELCHLITAAAEHDGTLPIALVMSLGLTPTRTPGNAWIGSPSQLIIEYGGQTLAVQE